MRQIHRDFLGLLLVSIGWALLLLAEMIDTMPMWLGTSAFSLLGTYFLASEQTTENRAHQSLVDRTWII